MTGELKIFAGSSNPKLTQLICQHLNIPFGKSHSFKFSDGNIYVKIDESVRQDHVFIVQSGSVPVNDNVIELLFYIEAFKRASAASVTAVIPFFPYTKGDKKDEPRVSIRAKVIAETLESVGVDRVLVMDLLPPQIQGFFNKPVDNLYAQSVFIDYIAAKKIENPVIVSTDIGGAKMARKFARKFNAPVAIGDKEREGHSEKAITENIIGDVAGKTAIIVDDMIISGGSLLALIQALKESGAPRIYACISHGLLTGSVIEKIQQSPLDELIITDTIALPDDKINQKIIQLSVAHIFAEAIKSVYTGTSMSLLFDED
ncbi:ribose-phosphate pyrophosphokinase [candidate division KSB1 bacterium]|nr:ribose-phosphate pyrophosphokinase [candidate division KSB1 bacterium]